RARRRCGAHALAHPALGHESSRKCGPAMTAVWGHHQADEADVARERIVDAAEVAIRRWGLARTRIDDIAAEANCGRTTIYRYFGNRDNVIVEVLLRQGRRYLQSLLEHLATLPDTPEKVVEAVVFAV